MFNSRRIKKYEDIADEIIGVINEEDVIFAGIGQFKDYLYLSPYRGVIERCILEYPHNEDNGITRSMITSILEGDYNYFFYKESKLFEKYPDIEDIKEIIKKKQV